MIRKMILLGLMGALLAGLVGVGLLITARESVEIQAQQAEYVGAETCRACHPGDYDYWKASGHANKLRKAEDARLAGLPKPAYVKWTDILFVVGGYRWKARYINQEGFFITGGKDPKTGAEIKGQNQFNLETRKFVDWEAGKEKKYDCGSCHTTGYSKEGNQLGKPGLIGTWKFEGIQCEACHGPGREHAATGDKTKIKIDRTAAACGTCHRRGDDMTVIPAAGGFIDHREQYQELLKSPHNPDKEAKPGEKFSCVTCHKPHRTAGLSIKSEATCAACHAKAAEDFKDSRMAKAGVTCEDCHMAEAAKTAVKRGPFEGDLKSHLFKINPDVKAPMFTPDGKFAMGYLTWQYACLQCHAGRDEAWAAQYIKGVHKLGK